MALYKRGKTWWTDFSVDGQRYRVSLDTSDWREAQQRERVKVTEAKEGQLTATVNDLARLKLAEALDRYLEERASGFGREKPLAQRTKQTEKERSGIVKQRLGTLPVKKITAEVIHAYIKSRKDSGIANGTVNRELDIIRGVLKKAGLWTRMADLVKSLRPGGEIGIAFSEEEKEKLRRAAVQKPQWQNARLAMTLALHTSMRPCEIKGLCWRDVDWLDKVITIRRSKTEAGERTIPLLPEAYAAVLELRERAKLLFGDSLNPDWYLFPGSKLGGFRNLDPTRPVKSWRKAWRKVMEAAGVNKGRFYDTRHTFITDLLEDPNVSEETSKSIVGHISVKMLRRYSHSRIEAKRKALEGLSQKGYVTNRVTREADANADVSQVIENLVDERGFEPPASSLRTRRSPS